MTKERLDQIEEYARRSPYVSELLAEVRRAWAEIEALKLANGRLETHRDWLVRRLESLRRYREAMEGLPAGTLTGEEASEDGEAATGG